MKIITTNSKQYLRDYPLLKITNYRNIKEGQVKVSRPSELKIDEHCLLHYRPHLKGLKVEVAKWIKCSQELSAEGFVQKNYSQCIKNPRVTSSCFKVFKYLLTRNEKDPNLLPRQLPHSESSKLVGQENLLLRLFSHWRQEEANWSQFYKRFGILRRSAEFRIYAPTCSLQNTKTYNFHGLLSFDWYKDFNFSELKQSFIVENRESFDSLCSLAQNTLLIFGSGWKASQLLSFQNILPRPIYYWGDIDKEGYEILAYLKKRINKLKPIFMDKEALNKYRHLSSTKESYFGPFKYIPELQETYEEVCRSGIFIEQEKIPPTDLPILSDL